MRYQLLAIGTLKRGFYAEGCAFYIERLASYARVEVLELPLGKGKSPEAVKTRESAALLKAASGRLISLDETGRAMTSRQLADEVSGLELRGVSLLSLLLGGAEGHSEALKGQASASWSLSKLTLPHELARLILLEQLYRAETIRAKHPYHRG